MLRWNPNGDYPIIDNTSYIDPTATIIGKVKIGKNVYVGPGAIIRADHRTKIIIMDNCNIQDRVIMHALEGTSVEVEENTSLTHGCIVHGPCKIGKNCFIGFNTVIFNAQLGNNVFIKNSAVIEGVNIPEERFVPNGSVIDSKDKVDVLELVTNELKLFSKKIVEANLDLLKGYKNA